VAVDAVVIAQGLPFTQPQFGHLPGLDEKGECAIDGRRSDTLETFTDTVKDLARRGVVLRFSDHVQHRPTLRGQSQRGRAHASAGISSHHWHHQSCPARTRSLGCQQ
jgi:hypothetical protein